MFKATVVIASLCAALALGVPSVAGAKGPGGTPTSPSSISVAPSADGTAPHWNGLVSFDIATTATAEPYVNLQCFQGGVLVGQGWAGYFDGALGSRSIGLSSPQWTSGAADCVAYLDKYTRRGWQQLASTSFHVIG